MVPFLLIALRVAATISAQVESCSWTISMCRIIIKQYRVGYGEGRVKCNLATDLAGNLLIDIWHWKCSHCQTWHAYHWNAHAHWSTQFNLALPPPMLTYFNTAWHYFCLLPNTAIECWCSNVQSDPQTMLKVEFHQAGVVCQTSTNMSWLLHCQVHSTYIRLFESCVHSQHPLNCTTYWLTIPLVGCCVIGQFLQVGVVFYRDLNMLRTANMVMIQEQWLAISYMYAVQSVQHFELGDSRLSTLVLHSTVV